MHRAALPSPADLRFFRQRLVRWFAGAARELPWRANRDAYAIWISEVMLQQTTVSAVVPYFHRFLARFPDAAALAKAPIDDVLHLWQGLGYYRRARQLHAAASVIVHQHGGAFPTDAEAARALPGLGRYTANAVLSQAFDARLPILETNSRRVLARYFLIETPAGPKQDNELWDLAEAVLPEKNVGDFNQALMELGALVCTPTTPRCGECPLRNRCQAFAENAVESIPARPKKPDLIDVRSLALVIWSRGQVLIAKRPAAGRWAGLWEFPNIELSNNETHDQAAERLLTSLCQSCQIGERIGVIRHGITKYRVELTCLSASASRRTFRSDRHDDHAWAEPAALTDYPFSTPHRKLAKLCATNPAKGGT